MFASIHKIIIRHAHQTLVNFLDGRAARRARCEYLAHLYKEGFVNVDLKKYRHIRGQFKPY